MLVVVYQNLLPKPVYVMRKTNSNLTEPNPSQDSSIGCISAWHRGGPGSNPGKGENFSGKISNWIVRI